MKHTPTNKRKREKENEAGRKTGDLAILALLQIRLERTETYLPSSERTSKVQNPERSLALLHNYLLSKGCP